MNINGFSNSDYAYLFAYVYYFEKRIKRIKTDNGIISMCPLTVQIFKSNILRKKGKFIHKSKSNEIKTCSPNIGEIYMTCNNTLLIDFMRHIRNSICHANLLKKKNVVYVTDATNEDQPTAKGRFEYDIFMSFVKQIVDEYDNINKTNGEYNN